MPMEDDWDLHAVVRGCTTTGSSFTSTSTASSISLTADLTTSQDPCFPPLLLKDMILTGEPDIYEPFGGFGAANAMDELHEICKPFLMRKPLPFSPQSSGSSSICSLSLSSSASLPLLGEAASNLPRREQQMTGRVLFAAIPARTNGSRRRRNQQKRICHVPAEGLSSDVWAWRKYGQKPIKGSPFPRGYYRCSTSKGCLARKQVERNRSDPGMFVITYTGEHDHVAPTNKSSLSGTTRQRPSTPNSAKSGGSGNNPCPDVPSPVLLRRPPGRKST